MNLHQRGSELIGQLKDLVLEVLENHPDGAPGGEGVTQQEIARRSGLHSIGTAELDHTCQDLLSLLRKEGKVESLSESGKSDKDIHWRLTNA